MNVAAASRFFAALALLTAVGLIGVWGLVLFARQRADSGVVGAANVVRSNALWLAWVVAAVTMLGSLYYSLVAHFEPCELCWYQRICVYPLAVILLVAAMRNEFGIWRYALPLAAASIVIAAYHSQLQAFPEQQTFCSATVPCTARYVWEFGFVSLPLMNLIASAFIATMLLISRTAELERAR